MKFTDYQYENVFIKPEYKWNEKASKYLQTKKVIARLYNIKTKESEFKDVTDLSVPALYHPDKKGRFKSYLDNLALKEVKFKTLDEYNKYVKKIKEKTGEMVTIDYDGEELTFEETIFKDDCYGYTNPAHTFIHRYFPDSIKSNHAIRTMLIDIETRSETVSHGFPHSKTAYEPVFMIQMYDTFTDKYIILGVKEFTGVFDQDNVRFVNCKTEAVLLETFIKIMEKQKPGIVTGFNSQAFDIPYLTNRIARVLDGFTGETDELNKKMSYIEMKNVNRLSPVGVVQGIPEVVSQDGMVGVSSLWLGINLLDMRELIIKYSYLGLPSYSLDAVSKHYGLEGKVDHSSYSKFDGFISSDHYIIQDDVLTDLKQENIRQMQIKRKIFKDELKRRGLKIE